jgi:hypothetical protein
VYVIVYVSLYLYLTISTIQYNYFVQSMLNVPTCTLPFFSVPTPIITFDQQCPLILICMQRCLLLPLLPPPPPPPPLLLLPGELDYPFLFVSLDYLFFQGLLDYIIHIDFATAFKLFPTFFLRPNDDSYHMHADAVYGSCKLLMLLLQSSCTLW